MSCCVICLKSSQKNPFKSYFRFPKDAERCWEWAKIGNVENKFRRLGPTECNKRLRICSDHFDSCFLRFDGKKQRLLPNAVPENNVATVMAPTLAKPATRPQDVATTAREIDKMLSFTDPEYRFDSIDQLCRLCSEESIKLTPIFNAKQEQQMSISSQLKFLPITVAEDDVLPKGICDDCITKLRETHSFITSCLKADEKLHCMLEVGSMSPTCNAESNIEAEHDDPSKHEYRPEFRYVDLTGSFSLQHDYSQLWMGNFSGDDRLHWTQGKSYSCDQCHKAFETLDILRSHENAHLLVPNADGFFTCKQCNTTFKNRFQLCVHERLHTDEKPYKCQFCDKKYHRADLLKRHKRKHSKEVYDCCHCKQSFSAKSQLAHHLRTLCGPLHDPAIRLPQTLETFPADGTKTSNPTLLIERTLQEVDAAKRGDSMKLLCVDIEISHSGIAQPARSKNSDEWNKTGEDKPKTKFHCRFASCKRVFQSQGGLRRHSVTHYMKRECRCVTCGRAFKRMDSLKRHIRIHTDERPFSCKFCGFAFKQKGDCSKHEANHTTSTTLF